MKKLIFVLLKLVEIPIIVFVPVWIFEIVDGNPLKYNWLEKWCYGSMFIVIVCVILLMLCFAGYGLNEGNIKLAEWIRNKLRGY